MFFVEESRKNNNRWESYEQVEENIIENFELVMHGKFNDIYIFDK